VEKEFVNPNLHVVLIHYPLALLVAGTLIELFSFMWRRHGFRAAGRWMILLGAMSAVPTALSGVYALHDVANPDKQAVIWKETAASNVLSSEQWEHLRQHVLWTSIATGLAMLVVVSWLGCSDGWRQKLHWPLLIVLLLSVAIIVVGAQHGGDAVYEHGTGVMRADAGTASEAVPATDAAAPAATTSADESAGIAGQIQSVLPPMQMHVILAGIASSLALASLGLSIRRASQFPAPTQVDHIAAALNTSGDDPQSPEPPGTAQAIAPAARFWLLAALAGLLTAAVGYWMLVIGFGMRWPMELWKAAILEYPRRRAHLFAGGAIIILPIVLSLLTRVAPRQKWLLMPVALLLVLAIAFQVWVGILLMFDTSEGPLSGFN
jgi:uncharacterized membrane protein